jgi:hypothetical protein
MIIKLRRYTDNELMLLNTDDIVMVKKAERCTSLIATRTCGSVHVLESVDEVAKLIDPPQQCDKRTPRIINSGPGRVGGIGFGHLPPRPAGPQ